MRTESEKSGLPYGDNTKFQEMIFYIKESQHYFLDIHPDKLYKIETLFKKNLRFHMIQPKSEEIMDYIKGTTVRIDLRKL